MGKMTIRDIEEADLKTAVELLSEGFPKRKTAYWDSAIEQLGRRPTVEGYPQYGLLMLVDDIAVGLLLMLASLQTENTRCNPSSWYVRQGYRQYSIFLLQRAQKNKEANYLNLSPAPSTLSVVAASGYQPYTGGSYIMDLRAARHFEKARVSNLALDAIHDFEEVDRQTIIRHLNYGCQGFRVNDNLGLTYFLYRTKRYKGVIPMSRFVMGDPTRILAVAGGIMRLFALKGIFLSLVDAPLHSPEKLSMKSGITLDPERDVRFARGTIPPAVGDLGETEISVFGP